MKIGTVRLVERGALVSFLDRVQEADDTTALFEEIRAEKVQVFRRKPRSLVRRDLNPIGIGSPPSSIALDPSRTEVRFSTVG